MPAKHAKRRPIEGAETQKSPTSKKSNGGKRVSKKAEPKFHEDAGMPSLHVESGWLYASLEASSYPAATPRCGKWLFFVARKYVDDTWANVKKALRSGRLGTHAKVSTAVPNDAQGKIPHVLCVYTYDSDDAVDVMRIREVLRAMGFKKRVSYKTDEATLAGEYTILGYTGISKYQA